MIGHLGKIVFRGNVTQLRGKRSGAPFRPAKGLKINLVDARIARTLEDRKWLKKNLRACMNCLMLSKRL
jgi:hypothetical protein